MLKWSIELKRLELKYTWAISRNATDFKINAFVKVSDGVYNGLGEAAPNVRYHESPEIFLQEFERFKRDSFAHIQSVSDLSRFLLEKKYSNSLRFAIESSYVHYLAKKAGQSISSFLELAPASVRDTAYTIPIMAEEKLEAYFLQY